MEFEFFYMEPTQGEVNHADGETELNAYMRVQQVAKDIDPLVWWKQHHQEFPRLARMTRQSSSPERLFSSVGLVKSD